MREVIILKWVRTDAKLTKEVRCKARFHQFITDSDNGESYVAGVIEFTDGTVEAVPLALIVFTEPWTDR